MPSLVSLQDLKKQTALRLAKEQKKKKGGQQLQNPRQDVPTVKDTPSDENKGHGQNVDAQQQEPSLVGTATTTATVATTTTTETLKTVVGAMASRPVDAADGPSDQMPMQTNSTSSSSNYNDSSSVNDGRKETQSQNQNERVSAFCRGKIESVLWNRQEFNGHPGATIPHAVRPRPSIVAMVTFAVNAISCHGRCTDFKRHERSRSVLFFPLSV